jgi:hypothetical protein
VIFTIVHAEAYDRLFSENDIASAYARMTVWRLHSEAASYIEEVKQQDTLRICAVEADWDADTEENPYVPAGFANPPLRVLKNKANMIRIMR